MREILFRGKRIDNGESVYGDLVHMENKSYISYYYESALSTFINETFEYDGISIVGVAPFVEVDPSTVGQYTGLTANGKKIFEGDIVKVSSPAGSSYYAKIEYDCGCYWISNPDIQIPDTINNFNMEFVEVIGNIHDNPELLEHYGD